MCSLKDWKTSGPQGDYRSIAAVAALMATGNEDFSGIGGMWVGSLLTRTRLFRKKATDQFFVSFGFETHAALGWQVTALELTDGRQFFRVPPVDGQSLASHVDRLQFLTTSHIGAPGACDREEFEGIPILICQLFSFPAISAQA
jgi:hypothetical protein